MTTTMTRQDIHRPSAIQPMDYHFVACKYIGGRDMDPLEALWNVQQMKLIREHMDRTGGHYTQHSHGGTCHVCGATAMYLAVFYHPSTNTYIQTGEDCAAKMDMGQPEAFRSLRRAIQDAREAKAGKMKAQAILADNGLSRAWELSQMTNNDELVAAGCMDQRGYTWEYRTLSDIVTKLVKWGSISDKQTAFLRKLVDKIANHNRIMEERAAEKEAADNCPEGRVEISGEVVKMKEHYGTYGSSWKMTVKATGGFLVWGTIPSAIELFNDPNGNQRVLERGDKVVFTATVTPSDNDPKFGFYKRPTKARVVFD